MTSKCQPTKKQVDAEYACRHLAEFVEQAWPIVEPGTELESNWHVRVICEALERQMRGDPEYRKLVICIPPGTMKSTLVSVMAPAYEWLHFPERRKLFLSNDDDLAIRDSRKMRNIVTSDWYRGLVSYLAQRDAKKKGKEKHVEWELSKDQSEKVNFENSRRGFRQARSINSKLTGKRGDGIVIDDPMDAREVVNGSVEQVAARLKGINNVIEKVLPSRVNKLAHATWTIIMQRLHLDDPAGRAIDDGDWKVINIQMEYQPNNKLNHPDDPRTEQGELMFPELFPRSEIDKLSSKLGMHYDAQYQQDPKPSDAAVLKRWYWCFWYPREMATPPQPVMVMKPDGTMHECKQAPIPARLAVHRQSWDMAFKDTKDSAFVVGQVWAELGADSYLLDQIREKLDIIGSVGAVRTLTKRWPQAVEKLVEDKANGPAVLAMLRREVPGMVEVSPEGGKEARMNAAAPVCKSQNVWLPHPSLFSWVNGFIDEAEAAPFGKYMDQVDSFTQYAIHRYGSGVREYDYKPAHSRRGPGFRQRGGIL